MPLTLCFMINLQPFSKWSLVLFKLLYWQLLDFQTKAKERYLNPKSFADDNGGTKTILKTTQKLFFAVSLGDSNYVEKLVPFCDGTKQASSCRCSSPYVTAEVISAHYDPTTTTFSTHVHRLLEFFRTVLSFAATLFLLKTRRHRDFKNSSSTFSKSAIFGYTLQNSHQLITK